MISSISSTLGLTFEGSLPDVSVVTTENIFSHRSGAIQVSDEKAPVLALTIDFELSTRQVSGYLAFLLDIPSSEKLISRLDRFMNGSAV